MEYTIYALKCPIDNVVKYVGATKNLTARISSHLTFDRGNELKVEWIKLLQSQNLKPEIIILDKAQAIDEANAKEYKFMVEYSATIFNKFHVPYREYEAKYILSKSFPMTTEQAEKLKEIAKANQTSQGSIVRQWIEKEYQNLKAKK